MVKHHQTTSANQEQEEEENIYNILLPNVGDLPLTPPSAVQSNFISYFAPDFLKPRHDQYVYRHANGLCVIGLASTHLAFKEQEGGGGGITAVDFNVGKSNRSEMKVTGKRKRNLKYLSRIRFFPHKTSKNQLLSLLLGPPFHQNQNPLMGSVAFLAPLEAILFDIDGTLCDSDPQHYDAFRLMLQEGSMVEFPLLKNSSLKILVGNWGKKNLWRKKKACFEGL